MVVIRASDIPPAIAGACPTPIICITLNTFNIPITVPSKPSRGAIPPIVSRRGSPLLILWTSCFPLSKRISLISSLGSSMFSRPTLIIFANGPLCLSQIAIASPISSRTLMLSSIEVISGITIFFFLIDIDFSITIASAITEARSRGYIIMPPLLRNTSTFSIFTSSNFFTFL